MKMDSPVVPDACVLRSKSSFVTSARGHERTCGGRFASIPTIGPARRSDPGLAVIDLARGPDGLILRGPLPSRMPAEFYVWSPLHLLTLVVAAAIIVAAAILGRRCHPDRFRRFIGLGCVVVWVVNTAYWMTPSRFDWASSIPLHFCNAANLFGAIAVLRRQRLMQGVIYFWAGLCVWAFITPTVGMGPAKFGFWVFWIYHTFLGLALSHVLIVDGFRPTFRDLVHSAAFTLAYIAFLVVVDRLFGWNYGFLGPVKPGVPTPVDLLGAYPIRILWMILLGAGVFLLLWLPFCRRGSGSVS